MSRRAYASSRGVDEKTIRKAIASGKIRLVDGQIDPEIADADWARNRDAGQESKLAAAAPVAGGLPAERAEERPAVTEPVSSNQGQSQQPALDLAPLTAARIRNTEESTAIKEITRRKLEGGLLESEEVDRSWGEILQVLKDRMRMITDDDDVVDALVVTNQRSEVRSILARAILGALSAMSKGVEGLAA